MRSKRLLSLLLALCLVFSVISPAAAATVHAGDDVVTNQPSQNADNAATEPSDEVVSSDEAKGPNTLRDAQNDTAVKGEFVLNSEGQWTATKTEIPESVLSMQLPACVKELRELTETYSAADVVSAFIVLEEAPLVETYSSINDVPAGEEAQLAAQQDAVIALIEENVLEGEELTVVSQFTYLTNAIVVETQFSNLESIAYVEGVETVFITPVFYPCTDMNPQTVTSGQMTGVASVWNTEGLGYTGEGMTIAILDTGLDLDHQSFAADPEGASWSAETVSNLLETLELNCEELYGGTLTAENLYYNAKVPFAFNYASGSTNVSHDDGIGDHGTHVAGISAANEVEGTGVVGMAPDAQIIVMKVFSSETGAANMYDILNALEDCMKLGVDVANMSLGSPAGFSSSGIDVIDQVFASIANTDLIVDVAAGNEGTSSYGSLWDNYLHTTGDIDNATISSPSTYSNVLSIASVDNTYVMTDFFTLADGTKVFYQPSVEYLYEYTSNGLKEVLSESGALEYVFVPNLGAAEDFLDEEGNSIVDGKIAVVARGDINFGVKAANAEAAGAVAVLIWNNKSEDIFSFGMTTSEQDDDGNIISMPGIPVVLISLEDGQTMSAAEDKTLTVSAESALRMDSAGGQMSSFSCWGVGPDLSLVPDFAGVGGNVYSCYDDSQYGLMSGTSMATPQVAGVTALVLQYLEEKFPDITIAEKRALVDALLMSTATPVIDADTELEASPRQQGAGLVNALAAVTAEAYLSVSGSERPKAELGDSEEGSYTFTFTVHNFGTEEKTYDLRASLLCEDYTTDVNHPDKYFMSETEHELDKSAVVFDKNSVTVAANGTATVTVTITLTAEDKQWIDTYFPNGNYVEGFIYLENDSEDAGETTLSLPFLGFYGDWTDAPIFDTAFWYENSFWEGMAEGLIVDEVDGNEYYHVLWTNLGAPNADWVLGFNPYGDDIAVDENGDIVYSSTNNVLSPNGDGVLDQIGDYYLSLMRNAKWVNLTYTSGETVLDTEELDYISKTMYNSNYGATVPFIYSWYYDGTDLYDFTDANGEYLADGTELTLTISGALDYGTEANFTDKIEIPIYIDTVAPVLNEQSVVESTDEDGNNYLTVTFADAHPAYAMLMNKSGTQVYGEYGEETFVKNEDGTYSVTVDVTGLGDSFVIALCDYGCNEGYYELTWSESGTNNPEVSEDTLYAYQVYDEMLYYYYGYDYMFGWTSLDKVTGEYTVENRDNYEYYGLTAADYAGGYVFAVDAGYNLLYMVPGLWSRNLICNLGVNVVDMAFDEVTDTMYLTTKTSTDYGNVYALYTVDLLTGDLTLLREYDSQYQMPWAMTFVDGDLYCCKYYYAGFFQVDLEGETYDLTNVTTADGSNFMPLNASGSNVRPVYSQSMTYSAKNRRIYWAYYNGNACELITIDPENWTNTSVAMEWDQEYVGLLTVEDDGYTLPESTEVTKLVISDEEVIMASGDTYALTATALPWNISGATITWSSGNEDVATVDADGVVTAVAEGTAVITASYGELSVSCTVNVVDIAGSFNAYNYYSGNGYGDWINVDMESMEITSLTMSPVAFIAADYNGHNGLIYGFDEVGQCYSYDTESGECIALGTSSNKLVADMAYDYSTGLMYAIVYDYNTFTTTLYNVNMNNGALVEVATAFNSVYLTLACDMDGQLYAIDVYGLLYELDVVADSGMGGGIGGLEPLSDEDGTSTLTVQSVPVMETPVTEVTYVQTMCYDHVNDVILWTNAETSCVYWLEVNAEEPFYVNLGDPSGSGLIEYTGMYTVPTEIPELAYTPVTGIEGEDMMVLVDGAKMPSVSVYPLNATNSAVTYVSADETIAKVENGMIVGVAAGTTTVTATLVDTAEDNTETTHTCTFDVVVKNGTDNIHAYLAQDVINYNGYIWIEIDDADPNNYSPIGYVNYNDTYMTLYSAEYVDGMIYAYGYDDQDWNANFQFLTIDPKTWSVVSGIDMGDEFPFVYDMAYDYTTGTMYALAGSQSATDLYMVNLNNGKLIECVLTEPMFMALAIDETGTIYAMAKSEEFYDPMAWETSYGTAQLYTIDVETGTYEVFMDTGVISNMLTTMAYDFDTGYIYWNAFASTTSYVSSLYLIDPADKSCNSLGSIGAAGAQATGLMIFADEYPETPDTLQRLSLTANVAEVAVGATVALETFQQPATLDVEMTWTSADETIATVDDNGVVTGVAAGSTTVTVSAVSGENTLTATATVIVYGLDDYFVTYNRTDSGFASIGRPDPSVVTNLTEAEEEAAVSAMAMGPNGVIYAYDVNGDLFKTCELNEFERAYVGNAGIEVAEDETETSGAYTYEYEYFFTVADMAWDEANERMLALGYEGRNVTYTYAPSSYSDSYVEELFASAKIYEVDLETGALTELCIVGVDGSESSVLMLAVTDTGAAYVYTAYDDFVMSVDLETGVVTRHSTLQNQGVYGSAEGDPMAMVYDAATNSIYMLFTQNGNLYSLYKFNVGTTALSSIGVIGEGDDSFAGLVLNAEHEHSYQLDTEWTEEGSAKYVCDCGAEKITDCVDENKDHVCDDCGDKTDCVDGNKDHKCDTCEKVLSECVDENKDYKCDICGAELEKPEEPANDEVIRLAGAHRWETAIKVADELKANLGVEKFDTIIIASGNDFADALAGSYLSTVKSAPILLSWGQGGKYAYLDDDNIAYIKANLAEGGTVYILGGEKAVPKLYEEALEGYTVKRLGGDTRFETNLLILEEAGVNKGDEILVCTSTNFADSLSASATGKPILLVFNEQGKLYGAQPEYLDALEDCTFTIVGGENAVCADLETAIKTYGETTRLAGENRFETSVMVAEKYFEAPETAVLAYAWNYPDGLCGGALAYSMDAPLILTMTKYEAEAVAYATENTITSGVVLGGDGLISDEAVRDIFAMDVEDEIIVK